MHPCWIIEVFCKTCEIFQTKPYTEKYLLNNEDEDVRTKLGTMCTQCEGRWQWMDCECIVNVGLYSGTEMTNAGSV